MKHKLTIYFKNRILVFPNMTRDQYVDTRNNLTTPSHSKFKTVSFTNDNGIKTELQINTDNIDYIMGGEEEANG